MKDTFPLDGIEISAVSLARKVMNPACESAGWQVGSNEFSMQVDQVGCFYASGGSQVEYSVVPGADPDWVRLFLNGQMVVALLHQQGIISFHASSFVHKGIGVMILGESGAGKSSLAASFALGGAGLLTDDITPVVLYESGPHVRALHKSIRIRRSTAEQLNIHDSLLREAESGTGKQYMSARRENVADHPLSVIIMLEVGENEKPVIDEPLPAVKFSSLRSEICMSEILSGMPGREMEYLQQLLMIVQEVRFVRVVRPAGISIASLHSAVEDFLDNPGRAGS